MHRAALGSMQDFCLQASHAMEARHMHIAGSPLSKVTNYTLKDEGEAISLRAELCSYTVLYINERALYQRCLGVRLSIL